MQMFKRIKWGKVPSEYKKLQGISDSGSRGSTMREDYIRTLDQAKEHGSILVASPALMDTEKKEKKSSTWQSINIF